MYPPAGCILLGCGFSGKIFGVGVFWAGGIGYAAGFPAVRRAVMPGSGR
jgi:hypothetical protein